MIMMEKPFSLLVFGLDEENSLEGRMSIYREYYPAHLTLPKPTEVRDEKVKYNAVIYLDVFVGPELGSESL